MTDLCCPVCRSTSLATTERLTGAAYGAADLNPETGERTFKHEGWTEVNWDSSTTIGCECRSCAWGGDIDDLLPVEEVEPPCCYECGEPICRDASVGVWLHDADELGNRAYDLNEDHTARPEGE